MGKWTKARRAAQAARVKARWEAARGGLAARDAYARLNTPKKLEYEVSLKPAQEAVVDAERLRRRGHLHGLCDAMEAILRELRGAM